METMKYKTNKINMAHTLKTCNHKYIVKPLNNRSTYVQCIDIKESNKRRMVLVLNRPSNQG